MDYDALHAHDSIGFWITVIAAAAFLCSLIGAIMAKSQRRNQFYWFLGCFLFPPLLILLILFGMNGRRRERQENRRVRRRGGFGGIWRRNRA
jgi:hypothetical protein